MIFNKRSIGPLVPSSVASARVEERVRVCALEFVCLFGMRIKAPPPSPSYLISAAPLIGASLGLLKLCARTFGRGRRGIPNGFSERNMNWISPLKWHAFRECWMHSKRMVSSWPAE